MAYDWLNRLDFDSRAISREMALLVSLGIGWVKSQGFGITWSLKVCRIMTCYGFWRFWAIISLTLGGFM